jgi:hypothetical protein
MICFILDVTLGRSCGHPDVLNPHLEFESKDNHDSPVYFVKLFYLEINIKDMEPFETVKHCMQKKKKMRTGKKTSLAMKE